MRASTATSSPTGGSSADTIAGFAPLVAGCDGDRSEALAHRLLGPGYAGADALRLGRAPHAPP